MIYIPSDNTWNSSSRHLPHHSPVIISIECNYPSKYTDKSEYDIMIISIFKMYVTELAKELTVITMNTSSISSNQRYSKINAKTLAKWWNKGLESATQTLKTTTQIGMDIQYIINMAV